MLEGLGPATDVQEEKPRPMFWKNGWIGF